MMKTDVAGNWPKKMIFLDGKILLKVESRQNMWTCNVCTTDHKKDADEVKQDG